MDIDARYEGSGYIDPDTMGTSIPGGRIHCEMEGLPSTIDRGAASRWLESELAAICTILCSWIIVDPDSGMRNLYNQLVAHNTRYRARLREIVLPNAYYVPHMLEGLPS